MKKKKKKVVGYIMEKRGRKGGGGKVWDLDVVNEKIDWSEEAPPNS